MITENREKRIENRRLQRGTKTWENKQQATCRNAERPNESSQRIRRNYKERVGKHNDHRRSQIQNHRDRIWKNRRGI